MPPGEGFVLSLGTPPFEVDFGSHMAVIYLWMGFGRGNEEDELLRMDLRRCGNEIRLIPIMNHGWSATVGHGGSDWGKTHVCVIAKTSMPVRCLRKVYCRRLNRWTLKELASRTLHAVLGDGAWANGNGKSRGAWQEIVSPLLIAE